MNFLFSTCVCQETGGNNRWTVLILHIVYTRIKSQHLSAPPPFIYAKQMSQKVIYFLHCLHHFTHISSTLRVCYDFENTALAMFADLQFSCISGLRLSCTLSTCVTLHHQCLFAFYSYILPPLPLLLRLSFGMCT